MNTTKPMRNNMRYISYTGLFKMAKNCSVWFLPIKAKDAHANAFKAKRVVTTRNLLAIHPETKSLINLVEVTFSAKPWKAQGKPGRPRKGSYITTDLTK